MTRSSRTTLRAPVALAALIVIALLDSHAHANGRYPKADQLLVSPDRAGFLAVRATFGLLLSRDAGDTWDWVCERAIGYSGIQDPTLGVMADGTLIEGLAEGMARSSDFGCNWDFSEVDLRGAPIIDLTVRRGTPSSALALLWDARAVSYSSRLVASSDDGRSFVAYGSPIDPSVLVLTLDAAPTDPHRVYASGTRTTNGMRSGLLFVSNDDARHWVEYPVPFDPKTEQGVYIAAVDPKHADTLYLRTSSATVSRLLVSHDAGAHFDVAYSGSLLAFALSPDGGQLYFGGEDGLHSGAASDLSFEKRASLRLLCLAATKDALYACSDEHSGFTVGVSSDGGFTFAPKLHLNTVRGPLACSSDPAVSCEEDWPLVRAQLGIPIPEASDAGGAAGAGGEATADAGSESPAGAGGAGALSPHGSSSCALRATGSRGAPRSTAWLIGLLASWLSRRHRLRRRRRLRAS